MLHRSHCFSCRILKFEVSAQVAPEGPECPANTVLAGNNSPPQPAKKVTHWGWPNRQRASTPLRHVQQQQKKKKQMLFGEERGVCRTPPQSQPHAHPTAYLVGVCCKQGSVYPMNPKWSMNESRWGSSFTEDKQERGSKTSESCHMKTNSRDWVVSANWLSAHIYVTHWDIDCLALVDSWFMNIVWHLFLFSDGMSIGHYRPFVNKGFRECFSSVKGGWGENEINRKNTLYCHT